MLKRRVTVKDQFGTEYSIQATFDKSFSDMQGRVKLEVRHKPPN